MKPWQPVDMENLKVRSPSKGSLLLQRLDCMNERTFIYLFSVMKRYENDSFSGQSEYDSEENSFSKWAIVEITQQVWDHPLTMASETIELFALKMEFFAATSITDIQSRIFRTAAKTAWALLEPIQEIEQ